MGRVALREIRLLDGVAEWHLLGAAGRAEPGRGHRRDRRGGPLGHRRAGPAPASLLHATANPASGRVADKAGFAVEGTLRSAMRHPDGWHDMHLHARVRGDA